MKSSLVLKFKGKADQVWREWQQMVKFCGHVTLGELKARER